MADFNNFYAVNSIEEIDESKYFIKIALDASHKIFKAHFPGNPVLPGACIIQMVQDVASEIMGEKLIVQKASNIKFIAVINPENEPVINLELAVNQTEDQIKTDVKTYFGETLALKMNIHFKRTI